MTITSLHLRRTAFAGAAFLAGAAFATGIHVTKSAAAQSLSPARAPAIAAPAAGTPVDFSTIAARVTPAVVSIRAEHDARAAASRPREQDPSLPQEFQRFFQFQFPQGPGSPRMFSPPDPRQESRTASGSGFIVSKDGYVLTNNHVIDGADRVTVGLPDRREFKAKVVGRDPQTDIAVLKIDGSDFPTLPLGDDEKARVGDWVLAVGNPLELDFTVTAGIISAKERGNELRDLNSNKYAIQDFIQTDAAINPGNSGGPLVNTAGEAIGINSAIASPTGSYAGYGFAIPITLAKTVMDDLIAHGHVRRAIIGALITDVNQDDIAVAKLKEIAGVKIDDFSPADDSPAKRAGMEPGDIIIAADGKPVDRVSTLQRIIRSHRPGDEMTFEDVRYGTHRTIRVRLAEAPGDGAATAADDDAGPASDDGGGSVASKPLGVTLQPLSPDVARSMNVKSTLRGLVVKDVRRGGPAEGKLVPGDVITEVLHPEPRTSIHNMSDLKSVLDKLKSGDYVGLLIERQTDSSGSRSTAVVNLKLGG